VKQEETEALYQRMRTRLLAIPGVRAVSTSDMTPVEGGYWNDYLQVDGFKPKSPEDALAYFNQVDAGYFETLGIRLLPRPDFNAGDVPAAEQVAGVNESMARRFYGQQNVLNRQFRVKVGDQDGPPLRIVGVVSDAKVVSLREDPVASVYFPLRQRESPSIRQ